MKIHFTRHGQSTGDVEDRYGGDYDDQLTEKGRNQSAESAKELATKGIEAIISSPLIRAQETAAVIAEACKCNTFVEHDLRERNQYGILTGMKKSEAKEKHPDLAELLKDRLNTISGAESYEHFSARITKVFNKLINTRGYDTIVIVTHGGPLRVLFRDILKLGEITDIADCACAELDYDGEALTLVGFKGFTPVFEVPSNGTK